MIKFKKDYDRVTVAILVIMVVLLLGLGLGTYLLPPSPSAVLLYGQEIAQQRIEEAVIPFRVALLMQAGLMVLALGQALVD